MMPRSHFMNRTATSAKSSHQQNWGQKYFCLIFLSSIFLTPLIAAEVLVYPPVPGLEASVHYSVRVRSIGGEWQRVFAFEATCKTIEPKTDPYFDTLAGWTSPATTHRKSAAARCWNCI
jgi:hypothetical protein